MWLYTQSSVGFYLIKGICREPQFQSKKRVQLNPPQVSTSLHWEDPGALTRRQITTRSASPPAVVSVSQTGSVENVETPLAPRSPKPTEASETIQDKVLSGHISRASADQPTQKQPADRVSTFRICGVVESRERIIISCSINNVFISATCTD